MGFFKKIFKGVGKVFKKIGRGIKKVVTKVGKFMNKIGIVGQIAMAFILPGVGNMLMQGIGGIASSMVANTLGGIGGAIIKGAGHVVRAAHKFVTVGKNAFNTVSQGVTKFIGEFGKTALNKIPGINIKSASNNFFGKGGAWEAVQNDIVKNASRIMDPFKTSITVTKDVGIKEIMDSTGLPKDVIQRTNVGLDLDNLKAGDVINFDPARPGTFSGDQLRELTGVRDIVPRPTMTADSLGLKAPQPMSAEQINNLVGEKISQPSLLDPTSKVEPLGYDPFRGVTGGETVTSTTTPNVVPDAPATFTQRVKDEAQAFVSQRYDFSGKPIASTLQAVQDVGTAQQFIDPEVDDYGGSYSIPAYVGVGAQDLDVMAQSAPRNFGAYANLGQYGSTQRVYDTILMNPVSTWSRDLASRYA